MASVAVFIPNQTQFREQPKDETLALRREIDQASMFEEIVGTSAALQRVLCLVSKVAPTDASVLITGETGTGKELVARAIHRQSRRSSLPFVSVNCAAIPRDLIASELFGHEKGSFTGAIQRRLGRFELAYGGTIFLDEVGELPLDTQIALLRVLQEHEFERVGGTRSIQTNVRVIAATNRDLPVMLEEEKFRYDLFYRLNVFPICVPPLRDRCEDIPLLVGHFVQKFCQRMNKRIETIPMEVLNALSEYQWPGNIRELQNVIERAVILSSGPALMLEFSDLRESGADKFDSSVKPAQGRLQHALQETERRWILDALEQTRWVIAGPHGAAAHLGVKRSTLQARMQKLGIIRAHCAAGLGD